MTRRELNQFVETLLSAVGHPTGRSRDVNSANESILNAVSLAMRRHRGRDAEPMDGEAALLPLLDRDDVRPLLDEDDALGQIHQALNAPALESAYRATSKERRKFSADEIPAVSQLFTPRWVVEFLLHNTLGRLWIEWHPRTRLRDQMEWLVAPPATTLAAASARPTSKHFQGRYSERSGGEGESTRSFELSPNDVPPVAAQRPPGIRRAADIRVLDPACGTMNFGLVAFELLRLMYQEELDRAGEPGWESAPSVEHAADIPAAVLHNNLFGIDIDSVALRLARLTLQLKSGVDLPDDQWNLWQADSLFDEGIARRCQDAFDVVVTNPPYVSSRNLAVAQVARMKKRFPSAWRDLYACFIERSLDFARQGGRVGLLAMQSFMFTGAYQRLRTQIGQRCALESLAHFGPGVFAIGNPGTLQTVAFVARKEDDAKRRSDQSVAAFRLTDIPREEKQNALRLAMRHGRPAHAFLTPSPGTPGEGWGEGQPRHDVKDPHPNPLPAYRERESEQLQTKDDHAPPAVFHLPQSALFDLPRQTWAYWIDAPLRRAFKAFPRLGDIAPPRQGLATTDNFRFVRYWWEVEPTHRDAPAKATQGKWLPYAKSGQFRRWYESPRHRVNWQDDGREIKQAIVDRYPYLNGQWKWVAKNTAFYGRGGITWSYLTSGRFSARRLEAGSIFDVAGSSLFPEDVPGMLAILNSSAIHRLLEAINPTVNFQVGDLAELPIPETIPPELAALAGSAILLQQEIDAGDETAPNFSAPPPWENAIERSRSIATKLSQIERCIDASVCDLYGLRPETLVPAEEPLVDRIDLACRWVSFAIGRLLGRGNASATGRVLQLDPPDERVIADIRLVLEEHCGSVASHEIESQVGGLPSFLAVDFFPWHVRLYRRRPPFWALRSRGRLYLVAHDATTRETLKPILHGSGVTLPPDWKRCIDDGIVLGLVPLRSLVPDPALRRILDECFTEASAERFAWMASTLT